MFVCPPLNLGTIWLIFLKSGMAITPLEVSAIIVPTTTNDNNKLCGVNNGGGGGGGL